MLATATGIGAGLSNLAAGFIVKEAGFDAGFLTLAAVAAMGSLFFAMAMPETIPARKQSLLHPFDSTPVADGNPNFFWTK